MPRRKSKKRLEMGEEAWAEYQKYRDRHKAMKYSTAYRIRAKKKLIAYKGGKCQKCGYKEDVPRAFAFHHRDPSKKEFMIGRSSRSWVSLKKEVAKCDLLCVRCHAEVHDEQDKHLRDVLLARHEEWKKTRLAQIRCQGCNTLFQPTRKTKKYCIDECFRKDKPSRKPSKEDLEKSIAEMTWVAMGRKYGVSDNGVRKWARGYGLL